jgi:hypothetical protein
MLGLLGFIAAWTAAYIGYKQSRHFVRDRLRYVEGVHKSFIPMKAGLIATAATLPVAWIIPFISGGAAVLFGVAISAGVSAGRKDIRARRYLNA